MQPLSLGQVSSAYLTLKDTVDEYVSLMSVWTTLAPLLKNSYIEVRYEDMVENPEAIARKTLEFLEIPWNADVLRFDEHAREKFVRSPTYADVAKPVFKTASRAVAELPQISGTSPETSRTFCKSIRLRRITLVLALIDLPLFVGDINDNKNPLLFPRAGLMKRLR